MIPLLKPKKMLRNGEAVGTLKPIALAALVVVTISFPVHRAAAISLLESCAYQVFAVETLIHNSFKIVEEEGCAAQIGPQGVQIIHLDGDLGAMATITLDGATVSYSGKAITVNGFPPSVVTEFTFFSEFLLPVPASNEPETIIQLVVDVDLMSAQPSDFVEMFLRLPDYFLDGANWYLEDPVRSVFQFPVATGQSHELVIDAYTQALMPGEMTISVTVSLIPEPTTIVLLGLGLAGLTALRRPSWRQ